MITIFILGTLEGWPDIMFGAIDGDEDTNGPSRDTNYSISLFFVTFIFIGTFFFLNLFIGAICYHFDKSHKDEKCAMHRFLTEDQNKWV
jgi:voltage-dependent calcium channel L type alpha-1D